MSRFLARVLAVNNYPTTGCFERLREPLTENGTELTSSDWVGTAVSRFSEFDGARVNFVKLLR